MIRTLIKLAIVILIVHAGVKIVPQFWSYVQFKDAVQELADFSGRRTPEEVAGRVLQIAQRFDIQIGGEDVTVRKVKDATFIETRYSTRLEYFPGQFYPWTFEVKVQGAPPRFGDVTP